MKFKVFVCNKEQDKFSSKMKKIFFIGILIKTNELMLFPDLNK
jgi:hypothetical protein